jgi:hypothetical protein
MTVRVTGANAAVLAVDQEFALSLARHLPTRLNGLRLCLKHLSRTPSSFAKRAPAAVALDDVNIVAVSHH